jgi:hypothetical protein
LKSKLLLIPLLIGFALLFYSWYYSYPITINATDTTIFSQLNWLYWVGYCVTIASMYLLSLTIKTSLLKWLLVVSVIAVLFSLQFFSYYLPGSDTQYFRGLTENFINTKNLDPSGPSHYYYQWPSYFITRYIGAAISGLSIQSLEFVYYFILGLLLSTSLFVYVSKKFKNSEFVVVLTFFISMFSALNYQFVPFTFSFCFVILVFMIESSEKSNKVTAISILFALSTILAHAFVPLFLILYFFIRYIVTRTNDYKVLFSFSLVGYFVVQLTIAKLSFYSNIASVASISSEYSSIVSATLQTAQNQIDVLAQLFSRASTICLLLLCGIGFAVLVLKRKLRTIDKSILLTGFLYSSIGVVLYALGSRAIPILFIPICLGIGYLFERFRKFLKYGLLLLIILSVAIPLHQTFGNQDQIQTKADYRTENYLISKNSWNSSSPVFIFAEYRATTYLQPKLSDTAYFGWTPTELNSSDIVVYTTTLRLGLTSDNQTFIDSNNRLYDNGFSSIDMRSQLNGK